MSLLALPFPVIDPVLFEVGPLVIRWYALAYIVGICAGWWLARRRATDPGLYPGTTSAYTTTDIDDLVTWMTLGIVLGGRVGFVLFYNLGFYLDHPGEIVALWRGGMSFHGGLIGSAIAMALFAHRRGKPLLPLFDLVAGVVPIGLFLGRIANFINGELWGRTTDVAWAMVFPRAGALPRHPSQLYEAGLEGLLLFGVLALVIHKKGLSRPGLVTGVFAIGYALSRFLVEFVREPDEQLGLVGGRVLSMGQILCIPMAALGLWLVWIACRNRKSA